MVVPNTPIDNEREAGRDGLTILPKPEVGLAEAAAAFASSSRAPATRRAYESSLRAFARFCLEQALEPSPTPAAAAAWATSLAQAGRASSTVDRAMAALSRLASSRGMPSPQSHHLVADVLSGIRRTLGTKPARKKALTVSDLRRMSKALGTGKRALRDRLVLVWGFAGAFRRSELVALDLEDVEPTDRGLLVTVRRSKTDQEGKGMCKALPRGSVELTCPVRCFEAWAAAAELHQGAIFRHVAAGGRVTTRRLRPREVARIVQRSAKAAGIDPARLAGHSLRAGLITAAARAGKTDWEIMRQTGHASQATLADYVRDERLFDGNPADDIGL